MKPVNALVFSSLFTYVVTSPLHGNGHAKHPRRDRAPYGLVSHVTKTVITTQTAYFTASQGYSDITPTPLESLNGLPTTTKHISDSPTTLPGATTADGCTQSFPCSGDITMYDPSVGNNACGDPVYQPSDSVLAIAYGMMGTLSSGMEKNPLCGRYVEIENPVNGRMARGMVVDKCMGCQMSTSIDLSMKLFEQLVEDVNVGRVHNIKWWWA